MTFDRRQYPRVSSEALISLARMDTHAALAHAVDVSLGGVRLQCVGLDLAPGDLLRVTFTLGEESIRVVGQCMRAELLDDHAQELAMCFLKMDEEKRDRLREHFGIDVSGEDDARREFSRIPLDCVICIERASMMDVVAQALNVSAGGIHFIVEGLDLQLGDVMRVTLDVDGEPRRVVGQLVRVTDLGDAKQEAALALLDAPEDIRERLREELSARQPAR